MNLLYPNQNVPHPSEDPLLESKISTMAEVPLAAPVPSFLAAAMNLARRLEPLA